ncbi:protein-L-isoaspartate(D-aspartate) O-methyltransferase [Kitasatospora acidiphila]|uniref:protein-L-isoaspartate(D-aspartate) O-methyltransferase n=1 Tax=Kitasatospora acidiphila TaxID=2567942 RepID=UPI001E2EB09F|nr:protein-L-isoaspartate(D-aspartate) O-methyltransferase [Kitasatospora acidiphila]
MTGDLFPEADNLVQAARETGIRDERLLGALRATPRAGFVPARYRALAYLDEPIPIANGQTTTQPSLSARMIDGLALTGNEHVLEVGTGLAFQTALLARLAADVVSIEMWPQLVRQARRNLARQSIRNVELCLGDGSRGVPDRAPYDAILVSAAFPDVPPPLIEQLRLGGRLVQPIGPGGEEQVVSFQRTASGLQPDRSSPWLGSSGCTDGTATRPEPAYAEQPPAAARARGRRRSRGPARGGLVEKPLGDTPSTSLAVRE